MAAGQSGGRAVSTDTVGGGNESAGNAGEEAVREVLRQLKGSKLAGFIRTTNLVWRERNFQIDFLVFVPRIGLVVLEVKKWKGIVKASREEKWTQEYDSHRNEFNNASLQVLRTCGLVLQLLETAGLNRWPIRPLVVFAHEEATILKGKGPLAPQTDLILKTMISGWIDDNSSEDVSYRFTDSDFTGVKRVISAHAMEYVPPR